MVTVIADPQRVDAKVKDIDQASIRSGRFLFFTNAETRSLEVSLGQGRKVVLWGDLYYGIGRTGSITPLDESNARAHLESLFTTCPLQEALSRLEGRFVGALIENDESITLFGDSYGRVDLYYADVQGQLVVSTSLDEVVQRMGRLSYHQPSLACLLTVYGYYAPKRHTIYEGIRRLGVGEHLAIKDGRWTLTQTPFTPQPMAPYGNRELHEYAELFFDAVRARSSREGNWVFLSSGWDSTSILATLVHLHGASRVRAVIGRMDYSNRVDNINIFEIERAKKVADYFSVPLDIVSLNMREEEAVDIWKAQQSHFRNRHLYTVAAFNQVRLAQHVAKSGHDQAVFTGEHSDGLHNFGFSQYAVLFHRDLAFREYADKMGSYLFGPTFLKAVEEGKHQADEVYRFFRFLNPDVKFSDGDTDAKARRRAFLVSFLLGTPRIPFSDLSNKPSLLEGGARQFEGFTVCEYLSDCLDRVTPETLYAWLLHLYGSFHWQGSTATMAGVSLDVWGQSIRMPFGDTRLIQFCSSMPEDWGRGLDFNKTKFPLKWFLANKIDYPMHLQVGPHSYLYDVDSNFSHSAEILYASGLTSHLRSTLKDKPYHDVLSSEWFNLGYLDGLVDDYVSGTEVRGQKLSDLMALSTLCATGWY